MLKDKWFIKSSLKKTDNIGLDHRPESLQTVATRYGITRATVAKWRKRTTTADATFGPKPASTVLKVEEEAAIVAFRQHTLLPLDDCLYALQESIPAVV